MLQATQRQLDLFLRYPARKVIGVVDTPAGLDRVLQALTKAGFRREAILVFSGDEGIRCQELRAGHYVVVVSTPDPAAKERAREAFREGDGHFVDYYGPLLIEHLVA